MDEAALQKADVLLREFPGDPEICRVNAATFQRRSDSHAAFRAIAEGLAQNPSHAGLLSVEALLLEETGNLDTAANSAEASLRSYPYNLSMWELLGRLYERSGKYGEVLKVVQRAEAAGLCGSGLSLMKAVALFETDGPKEEAQALFEEAKGLYPDKEAVLEKLGILYARGGRVSEAAELFDRLIELRETPYAYLLRGWLFANFPKTTDSFGKARARLNFKKAIELDGHYAPAWYQLGVLAYDEGQMEEASADFQRTLDADPGFSDVHLYLAIAHKASGDIESALRALDEGMALAKENDEAAYNRLFLKKSDFLYEDHRYEALAALGEAPAAGADEEQPQYSRIGMFAYACYEIGDDVRAEALFQEALAALPAGKEPSDADRKQLYVRYAEFLQTAKRDPEAALPYFAHAYEGSDTFRDVVELARAYAAAGRQKEAEKLYRARLSMRRGGAAFQKPQNPAKDRADTACADCMTGECFFGLGMYRQAKRHLLRAVRDAGNCTLCAKRVCHEALFALAKISLAEGDPEAARAYYGHVVSAVRDRAYLEAAALFGSGQGV
ncbi:MAG: tetratricopeptide repeat protein [Clostridiales Family XIII bacterium]|nr:tetratricopeptide repeat protein [Clostridiales Family XIII bacterium]